MQNLTHFYQKKKYVIMNLVIIKINYFYEHKISCKKLTPINMLCNLYIVFRFLINFIIETYFIVKKFPKILSFSVILFFIIIIN